MGGSSDDRDLKRRNQNGGSNNNGGNDNNQSNWKWVDLTDSSISYNGDWTLLRGEIYSNGQDDKFPIQAATSPNATLVVSYNGTQIAVNGEIPAGSGHLVANYTVDGGRPVMKAESATSGNLSNNSTILFTSPATEFGPHNLTIDVLETGGDRNYTLWSFYVNDNSNNGRYNKQDNRGGSNDSNTDVGVIVGGVLGGVIFLILLVLALLLVTRRRRQSCTRRFEAQHIPSVNPDSQFGGLTQAEKYATNSDMIPDPGSTVDTDSKFTFGAHRESARTPRQSWVPVSLPPTVPQSVFSNGYRVSDWSSYKGSSVVAEQAHEASAPVQRSRFSPYTTTTFTPMTFKPPPPPPKEDFGTMKPSEKSATFRLSTALQSKWTTPTVRAL